VTPEPCHPFPVLHRQFFDFYLRATGLRDGDKEAVSALRDGFTVVSTDIGLNVDEAVRIVLNPLYETGEFDVGWGSPATTATGGNGGR